MGNIKTKLSVTQIQLALRNSDLFNQRSDLVVPNVSWGLLFYEADLLGISRSGQVTEVEIKRSLSDLKADFKKHHRHDSDYITYFFYCVPESIVEKAKKAILENEQSKAVVPINESHCPALLYYDENCVIHHTDFGTAKRFGYHHADDKDIATVGRLASLRYWNLLEKTIFPEDHGLQKRILDIKKENRTIRTALSVCDENYKDLKDFLRHEYPAVWQQYINR